MNEMRAMIRIVDKCNTCVYDLLYSYGVTLCVLDLGLEGSDGVRWVYIDLCRE
jgi:hypothetical protein